VNAPKKILIVTPAAPGSTKGNRITAERWASLLDGYRVEIAESNDGQPCDVLIALHARRGAAAIARSRAEAPTRPIILALTGTDLYRDIHDNADAQRSLELADLFIGLHPRVADDLPAATRAKARWVVQSAVAPPGAAAPARDDLVACVLGHLRDVKDPLRAALAVRLLPEASRLRVVQVGSALDERLATDARTESEANPRYTWRGEVSHPEALKLLATSDLHVLTSEMEGGANVICEALACGVPTLSTRIASSVGLLGEDYPGFFPVGDTEALAALLERFERDEAFRDRLGGATQALKAQVDPMRERAALRAVIDELLDSEHSEFAQDVRRGLTTTPKHLSCRYLYDEHGSKLFEEICELPEYYLTRAEAEILKTHAEELPGLFGPDVVLFELGSGSAVKTRLVVEAFLAKNQTLTYVPVDISVDALDESARVLSAAYSDLTVEPIAGEYRRGLQWLADNSTQERLVLWLGSNVGNFSRPEATEFLSAVRASLSGEDRLLIGVDLRKGKAVLEAAYDDAQGVTARFNKNLLTRINRELGGSFDPDAFEHRVSYDEDTGHVSSYLVCRDACTVRIEALDLDVSFEHRESIHTEDSVKYSPEEIDTLAATSGFRVQTRWLDANGRFALSLFAPAV
jgi:L-histidine Nalpha-methyltransferase